MRNENFSIKNLLNNLTTNQKIGFGLGIVIVILVIVLITTLAQDMTSPNSSTGEEESTVNTYTDDQGYTVTEETHTDASGNEVITGTREDIYGNVTTLDPNLITTYFPYQVMREHVDYTPSLRYYLAIDEASKTIYAIMEDCDVENDKALIQRYINSIPIDLSDYTIEYELSDVDTSCVE